MSRVSAHLRSCSTVIWPEGHGPGIGVPIKRSHDLRNTYQVFLLFGEVRS